jgi:putative alpha-1,2-mannosidase
MRTKVIILAGLTSCRLFALPGLVDKVNPMIGASTSVEYGEGKTFPGAATPFGLVQLSPDIIGSPLFDEATVQLDPHYYKGGKFAVRTRNNSARNLYVQSATLNGKPLNRAWLRHAEVVAGGVLELVMGPQPNESWGSALSELPPRNFPAAQ